MTKDEVKNFIVGMVSDKQGCKATELATELAVLHLSGNFGKHDSFDPLKILDELVQEKRIIEIEYILPQMEYRVKSFYLPMGTLLTVK